MKQIFANNAKSTLSTPIDNNPATLSLVLADASSFPTPNTGEYYLVTLESGSLIEIFRIIGKTSNTLTADLRGAESTGYHSFVAGTRVEARVTKGTLESFPTEFKHLGATVSSLVKPLSSYNYGYVTTSVDTAGDPVVVIRSTDSTWAVLNYSLIASGTLTSGTTTSATTTIASSVVSAVSGKYLIQLTSGTYAGQVREVSSAGGGVINWSDALGGSPTNGDGIHLYQAYSDLIPNIVSLAGSSSAEDISIIMGLVLGG